jgi:amino acid adenylation domain-containing protein
MEVEPEVLRISIGRQVTRRSNMPSLSERRHHLLKQILQWRQMQETSANNSARTSAEGRRFAASFAQERIWFLHRLVLTGSAYNITMSLRIEGALDIGALEKAFAELIRRHESLRTHFEENEDGVTQIINVRPNFRVVNIDFSSLEISTRDAEVAKAVAQHAHRPFALPRGPLIRVTVFKSSAQDHVLLIALHHIVSDTWSIGLLAREINALYTAFTRGEEPTIPELPIQYADYSVWQRHWLQGEVLEGQMSYWRTHLADAPDVLELPTDRPRPAVANFSGATVPVTLSAGLSAELVALSKEEQATLYMLLVASFQILLSRWSGQRDLVVGSPRAGRALRETEDLIGLFVNTLPIRSKILDQLSFRDFLKQVRKASLDADSFQDVPFETLVEELQPERDTSRHPIFQVIFSMQNQPQEPLRLGDLKIDVISGLGVSSRYDLSLYLEEKPEGIQGYFEYATALFDRSTIERLSHHFAVLLEAIVENPDRALWQLPLMQAKEREQLLVQWNCTQHEYDQEVCVHELFAQQVRRTPGAVAVVYADQSLTYAELNSKSNQLAWYLRKRGIGPDQRVGICMERSLEMVVGMLGILKAGGAYVPLDPGYPPERLQHMLGDAAPRMLLTQKRLATQIPLTAPNVVLLDQEWEQIAQHDDKDPEPRALGLTSRNLAYVIYTSGSTGVPKGIAAEHRGIVNRIAAQTAIDGFSENDVCCLQTSVGFVDAVFAIFGPLSKGLPLILAPTATASHLVDLSLLIEKERVTRLVSVPSLARAMVESVDVERWLGTLRSWTLSGEELREDLLKRLQQRLPDCRFVNLYGSSEVAADATYFVAGNWDESRVPIGRPIANTRIYILDEHYQPVAVGMTGEIYVGGAGLARGYLNRAELTAERFIPDPFGGGRMYKTGDLGRWRTDGIIEYLSRNDHQVKIRGHRIELGEIEAQLARHEQIKEAVVLAREGVQGEKRLVAYVVAREGAPYTLHGEGREAEAWADGKRAVRAQTDGASEAPLSAEALHAYLTKKLPDYMVPSVFVELAALPLSPSGKVDQKALPSPEGHSGDAYLAPRTPTEEFLAEIWAEVLKLDRVGVHDNFFELGGHSMLTMKVVAKIFERTEINLSLWTVFQSPTVASMATYLAGVGTRGDGEVPEEFESLAAEFLDGATF